MLDIKGSQASQACNHKSSLTRIPPLFDSNKLVEEAIVVDADRSIRSMHTISVGLAGNRDSATFVADPEACLQPRIAADHAELPGSSDGRSTYRLHSGPSSRPSTDERSDRSDSQVGGGFSLFTFMRFVMILVCMSACEFGFAHFH
ncbi:unnamed protein product [Protopolystoma xenopodis]|uniref:Uncharacterized protein n=1 Tax=Protopolystoma xenopodis TaxID=117903 RepID=A0A448WZG3_9PLAT|nr:unnamed protein product [Protopolystoma xenopodis]